MRWTCQAEGGGPLWWRLDRADHWYQPDTDPQRLAADYWRAHPHRDGEPVVLTWWRAWGRAGVQARVAPGPAERHPEVA